MEVKNILKLAIVFLDKKDLLEDEVFLGEVPETYTSSQSRTEEIESLLLCLNLVYNEIARDYLPLFSKEEIVFEQDKFLYANLSKVLLDVHSLKNENGKTIKFKMYPSFLEAKAKKAIIEYSYEPDELEINSLIENFSSRIPARVFAYGVAMEYSFLNSLSTEALIWESRYKDALINIARKKAQVILPARRWIWCFCQKNC